MPLIRHEIHGRIRFRIPSLAARDLAGACVEDLSARPGVLWARANPACASLVVGYDPSALPRAELLAQVREMVSPVIAPGGGKARPKSAKASSGARDKGLGRALRRFAAISAVAGAAFFRTSILGLATAQTAFSPLGIAAIGFSLPLVRNGIKGLGEKRLSLDGFLAAGTMAAVAAGEAMTSFEILWINSGAELLSAWIAERSRKSIAEILEITSHHTFVLVDGVEVERAVADVRPGDLVVLHTGEKVSVDGVVADGQALLNEAPITGRDERVHKVAGDEVLAGTFVRQGVITVRASRVGDETYLARIMHQVQDSLENKAPIEGVADRLASSLVKVGLGTTVATYVVTGSAWRAFTVLLVMACPCATVLAASTAVSAAISSAARNHVLIKGGRYLEEIGKCDLVCFDKTGTLTTTRPALKATACLNGMDENGLLGLALSTEAHNHHPLAQAIKAEAERRGVAAVPHTVCDYHMGMGMRAVIGGDEVLVGNDKLAREFGLGGKDVDDRIRQFRDQGLTALGVYLNGAPVGVLGFEAEVRPGAARVIQRLRSMGVEKFMLVTGDEDASSRALAKRLGIEDRKTSVLPEEKAAIVSRAMAHGSKVLMVGDGINDALALARADVGVALGTGGSEVAVEAADVALVADDLEALADVYGLSRKTLKVVHQNFWIATGSNIVGVALGVAGLLSPVAAGLVHVGHSLGVVANSSRLLAFSTGAAQSQAQSPTQNLDTATDIQGDE